MNATEPELIRRQVVRIADLVGASPRITNTRFEDCVLIGPAILFPTGDGEISGCEFDAPAEALLWTVDPEREFVVGAIEASGCQFVGCRFSMVGFAGSDEFVGLFKEGSK